MTIAKSIRLRRADNGIEIWMNWGVGHDRESFMTVKEDSLRDAASLADARTAPRTLHSILTVSPARYNSAGILAYGTFIPRELVVKALEELDTPPKYREGQVWRSPKGFVYLVVGTSPLITQSVSLEETEATNYDWYNADPAETYNWELLHDPE